MTYNIHCLVHLAEDVKVHGNIDMFSAFPFESFLGRLIKSQTVLQQVIMRIAEKSALPAVVQDHPDLFVQGLKKQHTRGLLPTGNMYFPCSQYGEAQLKVFNIAVEVPNNCVKLDSEVGLVQNITQCETCLHCVQTISSTQGIFLIRFKKARYSCSRTCE